MIKNGRPYSVENGYIDDKLITDEPRVIMDATIEWIQLYISPRKTPLLDRTSYGIKHILQSDTGIYLTNNQFKDAMMQCGYMPVNPNSLNWSYCISKRSLAFESKSDGKREISVSKSSIKEVYSTG